jgi:hypothetical protein
MKQEGKPTLLMARKAAVLTERRRSGRTPPGSESRACIQRDNSGTWEGRMSPCCDPEGKRATGRTKAPGIGAGSRALMSENSRAGMVPRIERQAKRFGKDMRQS